MKISKTGRKVGFRQLSVPKPKTIKPIGTGMTKIPFIGKHSSKPGYFGKGQCF